MSGFQYDSQGAYAVIESGEKLDYHLLWGRWLRNMVMDDSSWSVPTGVSSVSEARGETTTSIILSSSTPGEYEIVNTITSGQVEKTQSFRLIVRA